MTKRRDNHPTGHALKSDPLRASARMEISVPNAIGIMESGISEVVATEGGCRAAVEVALGADGRYRSAANLYSKFEAFGRPIFARELGYSTYERAKQAGLKELLCNWPKPRPSTPPEILESLRRLRKQIADQIR